MRAVLSTEYTRHFLHSARTTSFAVLVFTPHRLLPVYLHTRSLRSSGGSDWILIGIFIWILISLLYAIFHLTEDQPRLTQTEEYTVLAPISLLTGWVSLAILVNFAAVIKASA